MIVWLLGVVAAGVFGWILHWAKVEDSREREVDEPTLPLNRSWLCIECDWIASSAMRCPRCGSAALLSVARLIFSEQKLPKR